MVASENGQETPSETPRTQRSDGLEETVASHISSLAFKLSLSKEELDLLSNDFERPKPPEAPLHQPLLINYHDDLTKRLNHLKPINGFDAMKSELALYGYLPLTAQLRMASTPAAKVSKDRAARLQELIMHISSGELTQHGENRDRIVGEIFIPAFSVIHTLLSSFSA